MCYICSVNNVLRKPCLVCFIFGCWGGGGVMVSVLCAIMFSA